MTHRRLAFAVSLSLIACAAPASAQTAREWGVYTSELARQCPDKRLQLLSPGDLSYAVEGYTAADTPARASRLARAADVDRACAHVEMGATCGNFANLRGFIATGRLKAFVRFTCALEGACHGQSDCAGPAKAAAHSPKLEPR